MYETDTLDPLRRQSEHKDSEHDPFTLTRYRQMASRIPLDAKRILDVGCNTGRGGELLRARVPQAEIIGLDIVPERISQLPGTYNRGICSATTKIDLPNRHIHALVAGEFLEHLTPGETEETLHEFQRVLQIHGRLILTTPNPTSLKRWFQRQRHPRTLEGTIYQTFHLTQHWADTLSVQLRMNGLRPRVCGSGRTTIFLGHHFPLWCYGSYMIVADKR